MAYTKVYTISYRLENPRSSTMYLCGVMGDYVTEARAEAKRTLENTYKGRKFTILKVERS